MTILKTCGLPTDYVDSIIESTSPEKPTYKRRYQNDIDFTKFNENHPIFAHIVMQRKMKEAQDALKLRKWLRTNCEDALEKVAKAAYYKEEINSLQKTIAEDLKLQEIRWECGWNDSHFRGCLLSFKSLIEHHPQIKHVLKGWTRLFLTV